MNISNINDAINGLSTTAYNDFGAHFVCENEQNGVRFSVYAPNAENVSLIGEFNDWNGTDMERLDSGVWTAFVPDVFEKTMYKFRITTSDGECFDRADAFAFYAEKRPDTASMVYDVNSFDWSDGEWLSSRSKNFNRPMNIYEVHFGSWMRDDNGKFLTYTSLAEKLIPYEKSLGATHIEIMPLTEHPLDDSWGYQTTGYFAATSRFGEPRELMAFINRCHAENIGVILDFVPVHYAGDFFGLHKYDGEFLYENELHEYSQWGSPMFDYSKPYVVSFMRSAMCFWIEKFHIDGLRFDAVSNLIYINGDGGQGINENGIWFMKYTNYFLKNKYQDVMLIAEDSSIFGKVTAPVEYGGLGFDYKWDLGWMNNTLFYFSMSPERREVKSESIHHSMSYFYNENYILPLSHDEVVYGKKSMIEKMYGTPEQKTAQLKLLYLYMFAHPGKKLCFMGNEFAQKSEWSFSSQLSWNKSDNSDFTEFIRKLYSVYQTEENLSCCDYDGRKFRWIDYENRNGIFVFSRANDDTKTLFCFFNFSDESTEYRINCVGKKVSEILVSSGKISVSKPSKDRIAVKSDAFSGAIIKLC